MLNDPGGRLDNARIVSCIVSGSEGPIREADSSTAREPAIVGSSAPSMQANEPIPHTQFGNEMTRICWIGLQLLSEVAHIDP